MPRKPKTPAKPARRRKTAKAEQISTDELQAARLAAELQHKLAQTERSRLKIAKEKGLLVERDAVERSWSRHIHDARTLLETIPETLALLIADDPDPDTLAGLRELVRSESRRIVNESLRILAQGNRPNATPPVTSRR